MHSREKRVYGEGLAVRDLCFQTSCGPHARVHSVRGHSAENSTRPPTARATYVPPQKSQPQTHSRMGADQRLGNQVADTSEAAQVNW